MKKNITVLGIDLAKSIFQLHGTDRNGQPVLKKRLGREGLIEFMAQLPSCLVGIEACGGSHYWARTFQAMGHTVKVMAPQFVKPYVKSNKNDQNDASGISEAVTRPTMKFVPIKTTEQQDILLIHRCRALLLKQRTALSNQIRGLLGEYGVVIPQGMSRIRQLPEVLDKNLNELTTRSHPIFLQLHQQFIQIEADIKNYDKEIEAHAKEDGRCKEIQKLKGIGPITASAVVATIGDPSVFKNGREVSAWLGLVPKQHSSGNKIRLGGISKRGDSYVRTLLIHGARSFINVCENKTDRLSLWAADKKHRAGYNKAAVALANKNARIIWAMLATGEAYRMPQEHLAA